MALDEQTLANIAATLTAAIIEQDAIADDHMRQGDFLMRHGIATFGEVFKRLGQLYGDQTARQTIAKAREAVGDGRV